jgi:hypothetical protein
MNQNNQFVLPRLRTLVDDVCGRGARMFLPRLVLDVIESTQLAAFVLAFNEEFDTLLEVTLIDDETTFRDLLEYIS